MRQTSSRWDTGWARWIAACVTVVLLGTGAPALAEGTSEGAKSTLNLSLPTSDPAQILEQDLSLRLVPELYADPAAPAAPAPGGEKAAEKPAAGPAKKGPPLPLYTVEGTGGGLIVPMAYLINPGPPGTTVAMPSAGYTFVKVGSKTFQAVHVTETFFRRIELGYTFGTLGLGDFTADVRRVTGIHLGLDHVVVHNFNVRGLLIEEGKWNPAVTAGATFKYNPTIQSIDRRLGGAARTLGMERSNGTDFTLTASKTVIEPCLKRPVILTGGIRFSQAAQLGYLGFDDAYRMTGEGSIAYLVTDWLAIAYEYRQKKNPYDRFGTLVGKEDAWQTVDFAFILSDRLTFAVGWLCAGNVANGRVDNGWGFQLKYEF